VIRAIVNEALSSLELEFSALYSPIGRLSIPPEKLLRAMLLKAFFSIRSERQLMERLEFDLLFRWFVGLGGKLSLLGLEGTVQHCGLPMSLVGHSRQFLDIQPTSASSSIAVIGVRCSERREGPCMDGARGARGI